MTPSSEYWRGKRVMLTGHTGFKGSWTALWLERLGATVVGMGLPPIPGPDGVSFWEGLGRPGSSGDFIDIRDAGAVATAFGRRRPEIVIHMAAQALVRPSYSDPVETYSTNILGLVNVLEAARQTAGVGAVINVTSDKCYENREQIWAYRENDAMGGSDPYSASKGCAELITASYQRSFYNRPGAPWLASARAGNVIGGGDWSADRLVPDCVRGFSAGVPVSIRNPLATRPWQHVLEPVCGYLGLAQALAEQGGAIAEGWNFGPSDEDVWPVGRVVDAVAGAWGEGAGWQQDAQSHPKEAMLLRVDATKARVRLGWRPRLSTATALDWSVEWYKAVGAGRDVKETSVRQIEAYEQRELM